MIGAAADIQIVKGAPIPAAAPWIAFAQYRGAGIWGREQSRSVGDSVSAGLLAVRRRVLMRD